RALPSSRRCKGRADMGKAAICLRFSSHAERGYTSRQPSGCRVRVKRPSTWETSASRCRVGMETRPLASNVSALHPWNKFLPHFIAQKPTFPHSTVRNATGQATRCNYFNYNKHLAPSFFGRFLKYVVKSRNWQRL